MALDLFARIPVSNSGQALAWYERLLEATWAERTSRQNGETGDSIAAAPVSTLHPRSSGSALYFFASAASFSRYFFAISSCSCFGTIA